MASTFAVLGDDGRPKIHRRYLIGTGKAFGVFLHWPRRRIWPRSRAPQERVWIAASHKPTAPPRGLQSARSSIDAIVEHAGERAKRVRMRLTGPGDARDPQVTRALTDSVTDVSGLDRTSA